MNWTTAKELRAQLQRKWNQGDLLRPMLIEEPVFPLRLTLRSPTANELSSQFQSVRNWVDELGAMTHVRVEWREINNRVLGTQRLPQSLWIDSLDDALKLLGRTVEARTFAQQISTTRSRIPALTEWLLRRPLQALVLAPQWDQLLDVVSWIMCHPRPGIYLRQVDIPRVHTKFIEMHRGTLAELLDLVLPPDAVDPACSGINGFTGRYGFRDKPARIRLRLLDPRLSPIPAPGLPDIALDVQSLNALNLGGRRVFITENEINFLAFPPADNSLVIFGAGYGWEAISGISWLNDCRVYYWGDIDTHGFSILNKLRRRFEHVESFLMDAATLMTHEEQWGREPDQFVHDLDRLTPDEQRLFDQLRDNRIREQLRLEQERIGFEWVVKAVMAAG